MNILASLDKHADEPIMVSLSYRRRMNILASLDKHADEPIIMVSLSTSMPTSLSSW